MSQITHFEKLIEDEKRKTADAMVGIPLGDSHKHARLVGVYAGLEAALVFYRHAARTDVENDGV